MKLFGFAVLILLHSVLNGQTDAAAPPQQPACSVSASCNVEALPSEGTARSFLQALYGYDEHSSFKILAIKWSATLANTPVIIVSFDNPPRTLEFYITADRQHAILGKVVPFGVDPFVHDRAMLQARASGPWTGTSTSRVLLVEFGDLECPACKDVQPLLKRIVDAHPDVKFIFEDFPLPFHSWAKIAGQYAQCVDRLSHSRFFDFLDGVYARQAFITPSNAGMTLSQLAVGIGVSEADLKSCVDNGLGQAELDLAARLGADIGVTATPTLFVNGRKLLVGGMSFNELNAIVTYAISRPDAKASNVASGLAHP